VPCQRPRSTGSAGRCSDSLDAPPPRYLVVGPPLGPRSGSRPPDDLEGIVAQNAFHRAFVLGPARAVDPSGLEAQLAVNGELRASATAAEDHSDVVRALARLLRAVGEQLQRGDHVLAGALTHVPTQPGDEIQAKIQTLGRSTCESRHRRGAPCAGGVWALPTRAKRQPARRRPTHRASGSASRLSVSNGRCVAASVSQ
jgi:hypothetical protein